jgi:hypothetical protein
VGLVCAAPHMGNYRRDFGKPLLQASALTATTLVRFIPRRTSSRPCFSGSIVHVAPVIANAIYETADLREVIKFATAKMWLVLQRPCCQVILSH